MRTRYEYLGGYGIASTLSVESVLHSCTTYVLHLCVKIRLLSFGLTAAGILYIQHIIEIGSCVDKILEELLLESFVHACFWYLLLLAIRDTMDLLAHQCICSRPPLHCVQSLSPREADFSSSAYFFYPTHSFIINS